MVVVRVKSRTFNLLVVGLCVVGFVGFFWSRNGLFLAGGVLFGVWALVNLAEFLLKKYGKGKPIRMVKE